MIVLCDRKSHPGLYPFTRIRHTAEIRVGILTIKEKWELLTGDEVKLVDDDATGIPANLLPTSDNFRSLLNGDFSAVHSISRPWHIVRENAYALLSDFKLVTSNRRSQPIPDGNTTIHPEQIFIEEGARVSYSVLNASSGPIYIGKDAEVMEGCLIRGPFSLGEKSVLKMGTRIYGATTLGPHCTGGGEIKNSVLFGYSNKGHDGYLGDSVLGEWCNIGAGTSNSNVKNTGSEVRYEIPGKDPESAGLKGGLIMGDYSRCAINTSFNTGTIVGICCSIHGEAQPKKFIPDFTWGNEKYIFPKVLSDIANWKKMKKETLSPSEIHLLETLYKQTL